VPAVGAATGAGCCCGAMERCLPKLPPPPKRFASAVVNKHRQVNATVININNRFMYFLLNWIMQIGSEYNIAFFTYRWLHRTVLADQSFLNVLTNSISPS
jgi:hypothetical protein